MNDALEKAKDFVVKYGISGNLSDDLPAMEIALVEMTIRDLINQALLAPSVAETDDILSAIVRVKNQMKSYQEGIERTSSEITKEIAQDGLRDCQTILQVLQGNTPPAPIDVWQPIETAPRDGTRFIAARIIYRHHDLDFVERLIPEGKICWVSHAEWSDKWRKFWDHVEPSGLHCPTHWMPLPEPPTTL